VVFLEYSDFTIFTTESKILTIAFHPATKDLAFTTIKCLHALAEIIEPLLLLF
jgi:hypothetical protein